MENRNLTNCQLFNSISGKYDKGFLESAAQKVKIYFFNDSYYK